MRSPMNQPLLTTLRWVKVAPFGAPVVPEVNWMLMASSGSRSGVILASRARWAGPASLVTSP